MATSNNVADSQEPHLKHLTTLTASASEASDLDSDLDSDLEMEQIGSQHVIEVTGAGGGSSFRLSSMMVQEVVLRNHVLLQTLTAKEILRAKYVSKSWAAALPNVPTSSSTTASSEEFLQAVLGNQGFLHSLTAQDILTTKCLSKSWTTSVVENIFFITRARSNNQSRDWYFPLFFDMSTTMFGMWHNSMVPELRKLPSIRYLLQACNLKRKEIDFAIVDLLASSGGLLLFQAESTLTWNKGKTLNRYWYRYQSSLMVTNPLTKEYKILPPCNDDGGFVPIYSSRNYHIIVDEITNSYKVVYIWSIEQQPEQVNLAVYDSRTGNWEIVRNILPLMQPSLGSWTHPTPYSLRTYASTCTQGRLYLADIREAREVQRERGVAIRLFEVDIATGLCKLCSEYPLCRVYKPREQLALPALLFGSGNSHRNLKLVECMGHLYAVTPARIDDYLYHPNQFQPNFWENVVSSKYMPVQLYIFQLEGDVRGEWVLRSIATNSHHSSLFGLIEEARNPKRFSCMAKGSVICVTFADCLFQFDVISGKCKTEVLPNNPGGVKFGLSYHASFHMKP